MGATIAVLYPNVDGARFDMDYYLAKHMPLVGQRFAPHGLTGWRVTRFVDTPQGGKPAFSVMATLDFATAEGFGAAIAAEGETVLGDVPNFSDQKPTIMVGDAVGQG